jgi:hypothetical protein
VDSGKRRLISVESGKEKFRIEVLPKREDGKVMEVLISLDNRMLDCTTDQEDFKEIFGIIFILKNGKVVPKVKFLKGEELKKKFADIWIPDIYYKFMLKYAYGVFGQKKQKNAE